VGAGGGAGAAAAAADTGTAGEAERREWRAELQRILDKINAAHDRMKALLTASRRSRVCHQLASAEKTAGPGLPDDRRASGRRKPSENERARYVKQFYDAMLNARKYYWEGFMADRTLAWRIVQYLSVHLILIRLKSEYVPPADLEARNAVLAEGEHNQLAALWSLACVLSLNDLRNPDPALRSGRSAI
jgi:hypothetical protein